MSNIHLKLLLLIYMIGISPFIVIGFAHFNNTNFLTFGVALHFIMIMTIPFIKDIIQNQHQNKSNTKHNTSKSKK